MGGCLIKSSDNILAALLPSELWIPATLTLAGQFLILGLVPYVRVLMDFTALFAQWNKTLHKT